MFFCRERHWHTALLTKRNDPLRCACIFRSSNLINHWRCVCCVTNLECNTFGLELLRRYYSAERDYERRPKRRLSCGIVESYVSSFIRQRPTEDCFIEFSTSTSTAATAATSPPTLFKSALRKRSKHKWQCGFDFGRRNGLGTLWNWGHCAQIGPVDASHLRCFKHCVEAFQHIQVRKSLLALFVGQLSV